MTPERWGRIKEIFGAAFERPVAERSAFLDSACQGEPELRAEVDRLLAESVGESDAALPATGEINPLEPGLYTRTLGEHDPVPGTVIDVYHLLQRIGTGGMGEVWLAEQKQPVRRRVAVKLIKAGMDTREVVSRFESERQALALMNHPAIAKVFDGGSTPQGRPYFVMEYVTGLPITAYADKHKLTTRQRLELFVSVCEGVQHAHQKAILHRDLKPSNILVGELDGKPAPRIIDFGVAKATANRLTADTMFTLVGGIVGTPGYMSPEQADSGGTDVDTRTDVYSLGVILYQLLVGVLPLDFSNTPSNQFPRRLREEDAPRPSTRLRSLGEKTGITAQNRGADPPTLSRQLRGDLDAITLKALEKDRSRRYATPSELAADIGRYLRSEPVLARPASVLYRSGKYVRRHRAAVAVATVIAVLLVSAAVAQSFELRRIKRERARADRVTAFMMGMFKVANPSETRGNDIRAREILDKASNDIDTGLTKDPELQAQMMHVMGTVYQSLGIYSRAESLFRRAAETRRSTLGARNPDSLQSMYQLAEVLTFEGRYPEAEKLSRETLDARRAVLGADHRDSLTTMSWLGWIFYSQGRFAEAEKLHRETIEAAKRTLGPLDNVTIIATNRLAIDLVAQKKIAEAEQAFRESLDGNQRSKGPDHQDTLASQNNLANLLQEEGKFAEAEKLNLTALEAYRRVWGPEHPKTLMTLENLGGVLRDEKRNAEAETMLSQAIEISRRTLGPENRSTLVAMGNLAGLLTDEGKYVEAEPLARQTLEGKRRTLGPEHPSTLIALNDLGRVLKLEKRYAESEKVYRQTFEGRGRSLGAGNPDTAAAAYELACVLALEGKPGEAFSNLQFALAHGLSADLRQGLDNDADLKSLHGDPRFAALGAPAGKPAATR
jgi:eukaryotic-like serine/threonine-protein kinase